MPIMRSPSTRLCAFSTTMNCASMNVSIRGGTAPKRGSRKASTPASLPYVLLYGWSGKVVVVSTSVSSSVPPDASDAPTPGCTLATARSTAACMEMKWVCCQSVAPSLCPS